MEAVTKSVDFVSRGVNKAVHGAAEIGRGVRRGVHRVGDGIANTYRHALSVSDGSPLSPGHEDLSREVELALDEAAQRPKSAGFFTSIDSSEFRPVVAAALTTTHPDSALRRIGLIKQRGQVAGEPVYFNPRTSEWRFSETETAVPAENLLLGERGVTSREDSVPSGIIFVLGQTEVTAVESLNERGMRELSAALDISRLAASTSSLSVTARLGSDASKTKDAIQMEVEESVKAIERQFKVQQEAQEAGYGVRVALDRDDKVKFVTQYLARALPQAAFRTQALIVVAPGDSPMAGQIGVGVAALQGHRTQHTDGQRIQALGVSAYPATNIAPRLTHHLVLQRSLMCRVSNFAAQGHCTGWKPAQLERGQSRGGGHQPRICESCGLAPFMHLPRHIVQSVVAGRADKRSVLTNVPWQFELDTYVLRIVDTLAAGVRPELDVVGRGKRVPPTREPIPVCVVLVGGDAETTARQLVQCIARRYGILIVEGSGGYADLLCTVLHRIEDAFPDGGHDAVRELTVALDPLTSEILSNVDLVRVVPLGAKIEEVIREVEGMLKGDRALLNAWQTFALWAHNGDLQRVMFITNQIVLAVLSLITTLLTVVTTWLRLGWKEVDESPPPTIPSPADHRGEAVLVGWTLLGWSIIVLPVLTSLLQALGTKWNTGAKWVALRTASEQLLSEIYRYRTCTGMYSADEVEKHSDPNNAGARAPDGWVVYGSREELLQIKARELTESLSTGPCRALALQTYSGSVPPKFIADIDDGFSWLTPEMYLRARLEASAGAYARKSERVDRVVGVLRTMANIMSAVGTALAAVAAYAVASAQAWIPFTTALVNSATRIIEQSRLDFLGRKYNSVVSLLRNTSSWWASLGGRADNQANRNLLIDSVEGALLDELRSWGEQMNASMEGVKDAVKEIAADVAAAMKRLEEGDTASEVQALREFGLEQFATDRILRTMTDPFLAQEAHEAATQLKELAAKVAVEVVDADEAAIGDVRKEAEAAVREQAESSARLGDCVSVIDRVHFGDLAISASISGDIRTAVQEPSLRLHVIQAVLRITRRDLVTLALPDNTCYFWTIPTSAGGTRVDELRDAAVAAARQVSYETLYRVLRETSAAPFIFANGVPGHREMLEICKALVAEEMLDHLLRQDFESNVLRSESFFSTRDQLEEFISELHSFSITQGIDTLPLSNIINLVQDNQIRKNFVTLCNTLNNAEQVVRKIVRISKLLFRAAEPMSWLFFTILDRIAEFDMDEVLQNDAHAVSIAIEVEALDAMTIKPKLLQKGDLVVLFPTVLRPTMEQRSQIQLARYVTQVMKGTPALRVMNSYLDEYKATYLPAVTRTHMENKGVQWRFIRCSEMLQQRDVCRLSKTALIKLMRGCALYDACIEEVLEEMDDDAVRVFLSALQSKTNNTYAAHLVDSVSTTVTSFDMTSVFGFENRARLVSQMGQLSALSLANFSKERALTVVGFRNLALACDSLSVLQLKEMVLRLTQATGISWTEMAALRKTIMQVSHIIGPTSRYRTITRMWSLEVITRCFYIVTAYTAEEVSKRDDKESSETEADRPSHGPMEIADAATLAAAAAAAKAAARLSNRAPILRRCADEVVSEATRGIDADDVTTFLSALQSNYPDSEIAAAFGVTVDLGGYSAKANEAITETFASPEARAVVVTMLQEYFDQPQLLSSLVLAEDFVLEFVTRMRDFCEAEGVIATSEDPRARAVECLAGLPSTTARDFLINLYYELRFSLPKQFFVTLAKRVAVVDLRELFPSLEDRWSLITLFVLGLMPDPLAPRQDPSSSFVQSSGSAGSVTTGTPTFPANLGATLGGTAGTMDLGMTIGGRGEMSFSATASALSASLISDGVVHCEQDMAEAMLLGVGNMSNGLRPGQWKRQTLDALRRYGPEGYEEMMPRLAVLTEAQLCVATREFRKMLGTTAGAFLVHTVRSVGSSTAFATASFPSLSLADKFGLEAALYSLRLYSAREPEVLKNGLEKLEARRFVKRNEVDRRIMLAKMMNVGSGNPLSVLAQLKQEQLVPVFDMLRFAMPDSALEKHDTSSVRKELAQMLGAGGHDETTNPTPLISPPNEPAQQDA